MESIDKPVFIKNEKGIYLECNKNFETFLGFSRNQIVGKTAFDIAPAALAHGYMHADKELFEARETQFYKAPVVTASKTATPVIFAKTVFFDDSDKLSGFIGVINLAKGDNYPCVGKHQSAQEHCKLTKREFEVLFLMSQGLTTKEIGKKLAISNFTASDYLKSIFLKLSASNRASAIVQAHKMGLI